MHKRLSPLAALRGLVGLLLMTALLGACAAGAAADGVASLESPGASDDASPSPSTDPDDALLAFARCMREHGVDMPDPQVGSDGLIGIAPRAVAGDEDAEPVEDFREADEACRHHLDGVALGGPGASPDPEMQEAFLEYARCMRDHGVDFPDPQFENGGAAIVIGGEDGVDPRSPEFQDADEACRDHLPFGGPGAGGGGLEPAQPGTRP